MLQLDKTKFPLGAWTGSGFQYPDRVPPPVRHDSNRTVPPAMFIPSPRLLKPRSLEMREVELEYREVQKNTMALQALVHHQEDELVAKLQREIQQQHIQSAERAEVQRATLCLSLFACDLSMWQLCVFHAWARKVNERSAYRRLVVIAQRKHRLRIRCARALAYSNLRLLMLDVINRWHCTAHAAKHFKIGRMSTSSWDDTRSRTRSSLRDVVHFSVGSSIQSSLRLAFRAWYSLACAEIPLKKSAERHRASVEHVKARYVTKVEDALKGLTNSHAKWNLFTLFHRWHIAIGPHGGVWSTASDLASELRKLQTFSIPFIAATTLKNCEKEKKALAHFRDRQVHHFTTRNLSAGLFACAFTLWAYQCKNERVTKKYRDSCVEAEIITKLQVVESQEIADMKAKAFEEQDKNYEAAIDVVERTSLTAKTALGQECEVAVSDTIREYETKMKEEQLQSAKFLQEQIVCKKLAIAEEEAAWAQRLQKREEEDKKALENVRKFNELQLQKIESMFAEQIKAETKEAQRMSQTLESSKMQASIDSEGKAQIVQQTRSHIAEHKHKVAQCKKDIGALSATVSEFRAMKAETQKLYEEEIYALEQYILRFVPFGTLQTIKTRPFFVGDKYVKDGKIMPTPDMEITDSPRCRSPKGKKPGAILPMFNLPNQRVDERCVEGQTTTAAAERFGDRSRSLPPEPTDPAVFASTDRDAIKSARLPASPALGESSVTTSPKPVVHSVPKSPSTVRPIAAEAPVPFVTCSVPVEVQSVTPLTANRSASGICTPDVHAKAVPIQTLYTTSYSTRTQSSPYAQRDYVKSNHADMSRTRPAFVHQNATLQSTGNAIYNTTPNPRWLNQNRYPAVRTPTSLWCGPLGGKESSARSSSANVISTWRDARAT